MQFEIANASGDRLIITVEGVGTPRFEAIPGVRKCAHSEVPQKAEAEHQMTGGDLLKGELQRLRELLSGIEQERGLADKLQDGEVRANVTEALDSAMDEVQSAVRTIERQSRWPNL